MSQTSAANYVTPPEKWSDRLWRRVSSEGLGGRIKLGGFYWAVWLKTIDGDDVVCSIVLHNVTTKEDIRITARGWRQMPDG